MVSKCFAAEQKNPFNPLTLIHQRTDCMKNLFSYLLVHFYFIKRVNADFDPLKCTIRLPNRLGDPKLSSEHKLYGSRIF
jgi:hypothetical protein